MNDLSFNEKAAARSHVWDALQNEKAARFPFPPHGRIPNFAGAEEAAERLFEEPVLANAKTLKVNPDSPQRHIRRLALERGITVYVPTPRLRSGFKRLDPSSIPEDKYGEAASLSKMDRWADEVDLEDLPQMDVMVTGCVAVTREGRRCGKGEGYSDLEFAILRTLGHVPVPVLTTVHPLQIVDDLPRDDHDLPLSWMATPDDLIGVEDPPPAPGGVDWGKLAEEDLEAMPILAQLKKWK